MLAIVRASERFKRESSAIFARHGVSFSQYNVLRVLEDLPGGRGSITEISNQLLVSPPNMSGIAKRLEKTGLATRGRDAADERKTLLELQPPGRRVLAEINDRQAANVRSFLADCPTEQKQAFLALLKRMLKPGS